MPNCPGAACWRALVMDQLPLAEQNRWEQHLEHCGPCQARLRRLAEDAELDLSSLVRSSLMQSWQSFPLLEVRSARLAPLKQKPQFQFSRAAGSR